MADSEKNGVSNQNQYEVSHMATRSNNCLYKHFICEQIYYYDIFTISLMRVKGNNITHNTMHVNITLCV
jgi:hypothetical protein